MSLQLNKTFNIKSATLSDDAKIVVVSGYASFNQDSYGIKEVDRDGEIVAVDGIDLSDYLKNPIVLFNHEWDKPFGTITSIIKDAQGLYVTAEIHKLSSLEGEFEAVAKGIVKAFSIGFQALEYRFLDNDIVEITKSRLLEVSAVSIPSNASSLFQVIGTKSLDLNKDALKYVLEANSISKAINDTTSKTLKGTEVETKKGNELNIETKTTEVTPAAQEATPSVTPEVVTSTPTATPEATPSVATVATPNVNTNVTPEPVQSAPKENININLETLVSAMVEADLKAEAAKEAAKTEALKKEQDELNAKVTQEAQRVQNAIDYIKERKEAIESTPAGEIDIEELDAFYELLSDTVEAIDGKVKEVVEAIKAPPAEA